MAHQTFRRELRHHFNHPGPSGESLQNSLRVLGDDLRVYQQHQFVEDPPIIGWQHEKPATGNQIVYLAFEADYDHTFCQFVVCVRVYFRTKQKPCIDWTAEVDELLKRDEKEWLCPNKNAKPATNTTG